MMRIDATKQLPQPLMRVYVSLTNGPSKSTFLLPNGQWFLIDEQASVTHWQALPEIENELRKLPIPCTC